MNKRNVIIGLSGLFIIGLVVYFILYSITPRATILLAIAPEEGFISIDNSSKQSVKNKQTISVTPGNHTVIFSREEFDSFSKDITVDNKQTLEVIIVLNPLTEAAKKLLLTSGSQEVIQRLDGEKIIKESSQLEKDYPILSVLPIKARLYVINSCKSIKYPDDSKKIAICVDVAQDGLEDYVYKDIRSHGYNPDDYEIIFNNISNTEDWD